MPPLFDSVVRLTVADMAGDVTFIRDTAYSFLDKDGYYRPEPHVQSDPALDLDAKAEHIIHSTGFLGTLV